MRPRDSCTVSNHDDVALVFTAFGQTQWPWFSKHNSPQTCPGIPNAAGVVDLMHRLVPEQRWGLAAKDVAAKGGWGPGVVDDYLVRQFASCQQNSAFGGGISGRRTHTTDRGRRNHQITEWLFGNLPELSQV